ncbi:hypothetical protein [Thalassiella azotivora]
MALFYTALHLVQAVLAVRPGLQPYQRHPKSHTSLKPGEPGTNIVVGQICGAIRAAYFDLYSTSLSVRYHGGNITEAVWRELRDEVNHIARFAAQELRDAGEEVPDWLRRCGSSTPSD